MERILWFPFSCWQERHLVTAWGKLFGLPPDLANLPRCFESLSQDSLSVANLIQLHYE